MDPDPELVRSLHGSMLPLVFGLPFAPELGTAGNSGRKRSSGALSQMVLTYWVNFANYG